MGTVTASILSSGTRNDRTGGRALRTGKGIIELVREKRILTEEQLAHSGSGGNDRHTAAVMRARR